MEPTNALDRKGAPAAVGDAPPGDAGLLEDAKSLWHELRALAHDELTLAALEARLAGISLVTMLGAGLMIGVLLVSAWLGLLAAVVLWLISIGVPASIALLLGVATNLLLALMLYGVVRRQSRYLQFPATLRGLRPLPSKMQTSDTA